MGAIRDWGKVFVAVRHSPYNPAWFTESFAGLCQHGLREGDRRDFVYSKTMHKAANMLVRKLRETDCDSICFIDDDGVFGTNALEELRSDPDGWELDILQAFTVKRGFPPEPMYLKEMPDQPASDERLRGRQFVTAIPMDPDFIYKDVGAVSLHFTLIRRELLEKMVVDEGDRYTYWFEYSRDNGEDITFSHNARKFGAKMGMSTRLKVGHVSEIITGWDTMVEYYFYEAMHASGQLPKPSLDYMLPYYDAAKQLAGLVAEYTGEDAEAVFEKSMSGQILVTDRWMLENPQTPEQVRAFYGHTPQYLYGLVKWNSTVVYQRILGMLRGVTGENIFEFGGGIGTTTEYLATHGNTVTYYDLPGLLLDFATWRFARLNGYRQNVKLFDGLAEQGSFDRVVAIDSIEHIHPDEFDATLDWLVSLLKAGGVLFAHNNFLKEDEPYPSHYAHQAKWDAFVIRHGLKAGKEFEWVKPMEATT